MASVTISARTDEETKEKLSEESTLRGHSLSEAVDHIIKIGMPKYLKQFPRKYAKLDQDGDAVAA